MAAGAALVRRLAYNGDVATGQLAVSSLKGASRKMAESMSEKQLRDFAKTKRKKLPSKRT